jgi:hypothetical protein
VALSDHLTATDLALEAYERALMPMPIDGHFDAYETDFASSDWAAVDWFKQHLRSY